MKKMVSFKNSNTCKEPKPRKLCRISLQSSDHSQTKVGPLGTSKEQGSKLSYTGINKLSPAKTKLLYPSSTPQRLNLSSILDHESTRGGYSGSNSSSSNRFLSPSSCIFTKAFSKFSPKARIQRNRSKVYANTTIFRLDSRLLCESLKVNKIKTMLRCNKGQLIRLIKHHMKDQYWAILNSDSKFGVKTEAELIDSRFLKPDFSEYPVGKFIDSCNMPSIDQTFNVQAVGYLKNDLKSVSTAENYLEGHPGELVCVCSEASFDTVYAYKANDPKCALQLLKSNDIIYTTFHY
ncbi:unnamed protein product [Moneuplotes crassus]|uniref:Uncharacterized protein n=1 Tax=Euplotes crassus TaxID=5936 RepID=A0AAD1UJQ6_EUPCR|nr:unnamed protein product [Moneuplotes crassus]